MIRTIFYLAVVRSGDQDWSLHSINGCPVGFCSKTAAKREAQQIRRVAIGWLAVVVRSKVQDCPLEPNYRIGWPVGDEVFRAVTGKLDGFQLVK